MTAKELIAELSDLDPDTLVLSRYGEDGDLSDVSKPQRIKVHGPDFYYLCTGTKGCHLCKPSSLRVRPDGEAVGAVEV